MKTTKENSGVRPAAPSGPGLRAGVGSGASGVGCGLPGRPGFAGSGADSGASDAASHRPCRKGFAGAGALLRAVVCCAALVLIAPQAGAQKLAVKANALSWLTTTPQAEVEGAVGPHWTVALAGSWNPWKFGDNKKFKHWELRPAGRYWLWEAFNGHFFGVSAEYGQFNVGGMKATPFSLMFSDTNKTRYEGSFFGASLSYGYSWMLTPRWSIEAEVGVGYRRAAYRSYDCVTCGRPLVDGAPKQHKGYFGPTRLAVSVVFMIR